MPVLTVHTVDATETAIANVQVVAVRLRNDKPTSLAETVVSSAQGIATFDLESGTDYLIHWVHGFASITRRIRMPSINADLHDLNELDASSSGGGTGTGLTIGDVIRIVSEQLDAYDFPSEGGGNGLSQTQVNQLITAALAAHSSNANAHHTPPSVPDTTQYLTGSAITTLVNQLINNHSANSTAHHTPPDVSDFLDEEEVQDTVGEMFSEQSEVTYDDNTGKLSIAFPAGSGGGGGTSDYDLLSDRPIERVSSLPVASASTVGKRYQVISTGRQFVGTQTVTHDNRVVTYTPFPIVTSGAGYYGAIESVYQLPADVPAVGEYWFLQYSALHQGEPFIEANASRAYQGHAGFPGSGTYRGAYLSKAEADASIQSVSDVVAFGNSESQLVLYNVETFNAGSPDVTHYQLDPTDRIPLPDIDEEVTGLVSPWALQDDTSEIPSDKHDESWIDSKISAALAAYTPPASSPLSYLGMYTIPAAVSTSARLDTGFDMPEDAKLMGLQYDAGAWTRLYDRFGVSVWIDVRNFESLDAVDAGGQSGGQFMQLVNRSAEPDAQPSISIQLYRQTPRRIRIRRAGAGISTVIDTVIHFWIMT